jgi:hypothetical protein
MSLHRKNEEDSTMYAGVPKHPRFTFPVRAGRVFPTTLSVFPTSLPRLPALLAAVLIPAAAFAETDWVLVLDRSESMTQNDPRNARFDAQKIMVDLLAQAIDDTHKLTLIRFAGTADVILDREVISAASLEKIRKTISEDPPQGDTDIGAALALARKTVKPEGRAADVHVVLLSDGVQAGKIPNLFGRLDAEKKAYQELGLAVHTLLLNDLSISAQEREERRRKKLYYEDKQLQAGEDLLRDISRRTGGQAAQIRSGVLIEDVLLELIAPHISFYREKLPPRLQTLPTDRQLFLYLSKRSRDMKLRIGSTELDVSLMEPSSVKGDFNVTVSSYQQKSVVTIQPAENARWPEWVEFLPGKGGPPEGEVFVVSNVRLTTMPGLEGEDRTQNTLKTRVLENELYPVRFSIEVDSRVSEERKRNINDVIKRSTVRVDVLDAAGKVVDSKPLRGADVFQGTGNRFYFVPTQSPSGETKVKDPFPLTLRARLEVDGGPSQRALVRAPDRTLVVSPSSLEWLATTQWKGAPEGSAKGQPVREIEVQLGQDVRLEVVHSGSQSLGDAEMYATFGKAADTAVRRLTIKDAGGIPHTFHTDWITPPEPGEYRAKLTVKTAVVQEVSYSIRVVRDDFRAASALDADPSEAPKGVDLGSHFINEWVRFSRVRTLSALTPEETAKRWEAAAKTPPTVEILMKDPRAGWKTLKEIPIAAEEPKTDDRGTTAVYRGEVTGLEPGEYVVAWPDTRPKGDDPTAEPRSDLFVVRGRAYTTAMAGEDGKPLPVEAGKPTLLAGQKLTVRVVPEESFRPAGAALEGTLTWARKDVGAPQTAKATLGGDGSAALEFPTTDFHTGVARLHLKTTWKSDGKDRAIEEDIQVFSRPKALGIAIEPVQEELLLGEEDAAIRFRILSVGGQTAEVQRDLKSLWLSQPANATIGESDQIYTVELEAEGEALAGEIALPYLPVGTHKLVVTSPVAKLGQDVAACFFKVKPCAFEVKLLRTALGEEPRVLLGPGVTNASASADGAGWIVIESNAGERTEKAAKIVSAELTVGRRKVGASWTAEPLQLPAGGKAKAEDGAADEILGNVVYRSEALPLEEFAGLNEVSVRFADDAGKKFRLSLGKVEVVPVPMRHDVAWSTEAPRELGRGGFHRLLWTVHIHGGSREERKKAREALVASKASFLKVTPPSILKQVEVLGSPIGGPGSGGAYGESVPFAALLKVDPQDTAVKDRFTLEMSLGGQKQPMAKTVAIGPPAHGLLAGRLDQGGTLVPADGVPFFAKERLHFRIEDLSGSSRGNSRIQVVAAEGDPEAAGKTIASADARDLEWTPRREGSYRVIAEITSETGSGWSAEEAINVAPPLKLEWAGGDLAGTLKLDSGQKLPLSIRVVAPGLEAEAFHRFFDIRVEVKAEGGQNLAVEVSPWEGEKEDAAGAVVLRSFSTKPLTASAARVRISLVPKAAKTAPGETVEALDALEFDLLRGGGSLVVVEGFEKGESGQVTHDLFDRFTLPMGSHTRFGYRVGSSVGGGGAKDAVTAAVADPDGSEKVLDVEAVHPELVVFTPYEAVRYGKHKLRLEIRGGTQLEREFEFEVVKGTTQWALFAAAMGAGGIALVGLAFLGLRGLAYNRDRAQVRARIGTRKEKALQELRAIPVQNLEGTVRLNLGPKAVGPLELNGRPSVAEVEAWVDKHFSMETTIFADKTKNDGRMPVIKACLVEARTHLLAETEKKLPIRATDICVREAKGGAGRDGIRLDAEVVHDLTQSVPGRHTILSLRLLDDGKLRVSTAAGRSVTLDRKEDFAYNGWIGKKGSQIRASVKVPGIADYSTLIIDLN